MSRWGDEFKNLEMFRLIEQILSQCDVVIEKFPNNIEAALELKRTQNVLIFAKNTFSSFIPELAPIQFMKTFIEPLAKIKDFLEAYAQNENNLLIYNSSNPDDTNTINYHVNNILHHSIMYSKGNSSNVEIDLVVEEYEKYIKTFKEGSLSFINTKAKMEAKLQESIQKITDLNTRIYGIEGDQESIKNSISNHINVFLEQSSKNYESIQKYVNELLDESHGESIKTRIQTFQINSKKDSEEITNLLLGIQKETKELRSFYVEVYGSSDENNGLKKEFSDMNKKLKDYESTQQSAHKTLLEKANELLSLTTTIGLSKAFNNLKSSFFKANILWNCIFILSICMMLVLAKNIFPDEKKHYDLNATIASNSQLSITKSEENLWANILLNFSKELPFYVPLVWLAIFASRRRSENKRLEQEYAHKEAVAITYDSYKKQIELIGDAHNKEMLLKLLDKAIDTVAYNASVTLDESKHTESTPSHELLQDIFSKVKDFTPDMIKKFQGK